jgi:magnesium transporter
LGVAFGIHTLALEDILHTGQRPKLENFGGPLFVVLSRPHWRDERAVTEQVSLFFDERVLVSFYAGESDPFEPVRKRLREGMGDVRRHATDFLFHLLIDLVIDQGFPILDECAAWIEQLEEQLMDKPRVEVLRDLHQLRRDLVLLRRMLWPQRDIINTLLRDAHPLIRADTRLYLRDCYDHSVQVIEILESFKETSASLMELYLSSTSNRLNEVMRVLTIIATLFIPPTFVVGVYGMNFDHMPELHWEYGYALAWLIIVAMVGGLLYYFKRNDWM